MSLPSFEDKEIQYAYSSIHDFFDHFGLSGAVQDIETILVAATSHKVWKKSTPYMLLYYMQKLELLYTAAFTIHFNNSPRAEAILDQTKNAQPDMAITQHYTGRQIPPTSWNYFPRSLTAGQYQNPYKAIKKFCLYKAEQEWRQVLKELTEYALGNDTINESYPPYNILTIRLRLLQLIEACHLLEVRTNIKSTKPHKTKKVKK